MEPRDNISEEKQQTMSLFYPLFYLRKQLDLLTKKESELQVDAFSSDFQHMGGQKDSPDHPF